MKPGSAAICIIAGILCLVAAGVNGIGGPSSTFTEAPHPVIAMSFLGIFFAFIVLLFNEFD